jgi:hypothetical protein
MEKIVLLKKTQLRALVWCIEEYLSEKRFAETWKQMMKDSPELAEIHNTIAPAVKTFGQKLSHCEGFRGNRSKK